MKTILLNWPEKISPTDHTVVAFRKIVEPHGWLGNMSAHALRVPRIPGGQLYPTCEHYFQCSRFNDPAIQSAIHSKASPMSAKMVAKRYKAQMVIAPRSSEDLDLMREVLRLKLENHPKLKAELLALPADAIIIENATERSGESARFWGMKFENGVWTGSNWLGRIWMEML